MGENTKIEWAHHTFNPWRGCTKVSPGCANCYAESLSKRNPKLLGKWGPYGTRVVASDEMWSEPIKWNRIAGESGVRQRVFCASLADVFEDWNNVVVDHQGHPIPGFGSIGGMPTGFDLTLNDIRKYLFLLIDATPNLDWLLVTKRPENILRMTPCKQDNNGDGDCPGCSRGNNLCKYRPNVWLLTSVENQEQADKRIPELLKCRDLSPVLGLSCEPLLGPVDLVDPISKHLLKQMGIITEKKIVSMTGDSPIDWIIVGGESGHDARPMHPDWARSLRDQCDKADIPFFFKQWGEWSVGVKTQYDRERGASQFREGAYHDFGDDYMALRTGKKSAGRIIDFHTHDEFPLATRQ